MSAWLTNRTVQSNALQLDIERLPASARSQSGLAHVASALSRPMLMELARLAIAVAASTDIYTTERP